MYIVTMAYLDMNVSPSECTEEDFAILSKLSEEDSRLFINLSPLDPLDCTSGTPTGGLNRTQQEALLLHLEKATRFTSAPRFADLTLESFLPLSMRSLLSKPKKETGPLTKLHNRLEKCDHASVSTLRSHNKRVDLGVRSCKRVTISDATVLDEFFAPVLADSLDLGWWQELEDVTESLPTKLKQLIISFCSSFSSKEEAYWSRFRIDPSHYDILFYEEGGKFEFHRDRISQWPFPMWENKYTDKHSTLSPSPNLAEWQMYACIYCIDSNIDPILPDGNTEVLLPLQGFSEMRRHYTEESAGGSASPEIETELFDNTSVPNKIAEHYMGDARKGMIHRFSEGIRPGKFVMFPANALHRSLHVGKNKFKTALKFDVWLRNAPTAWEEFPHALTEIAREEFKAWESTVSNGSITFRTPLEVSGVLKDANEDCCYNCEKFGYPCANCVSAWHRFPYPIYPSRFASTYNPDQLLGDVLDNEDYRSIKYKSVYNKADSLLLSRSLPVSDEEFQSLKTSFQLQRSDDSDSESEDESQDTYTPVINHHPMSVPSSMTGIFHQSLNQQNDSIVSRALARCGKEREFKVCTCKSCAPRQQALGKVGSILSKLLVSGYTRTNGFQFRSELATDVISLISEFVVGRTDSSGFVCICEVREFTELGESRLSNALSCICTCPACLVRPSCKRQFNTTQYWSSEEDDYSYDDYDCNSNGSD